MTSKPPKLN